MKSRNKLRSLLHFQDIQKAVRTSQVKNSEDYIKELKCLPVWMRLSKLTENLNIIFNPPNIRTWYQRNACQTISDTSFPDFLQTIYIFTGHRTSTHSSLRRGAPVSLAFRLNNDRSQYRNRIVNSLRIFIELHSLLHERQQSVSVYREGCKHVRCQNIANYMEEVLEILCALSRLQEETTAAYETFQKLHQRLWTPRLSTVSWTTFNLIKEHTLPSLHNNTATIIIHNVGMKWLPEGREDRWSGILKGLSDKKVSKLISNDLRTWFLKIFGIYEYLPTNLVHYLYSGSARTHTI
jgi:hypothetical protein